MQWESHIYNKYTNLSSFCCRKPRLKNSWNIYIAEKTEACCELTWDWDPWEPLNIAPSKFKLQTFAPTNGSEWRKLRSNYTETSGNFETYHGYHYLYWGGQGYWYVWIICLGPQEKEKRKGDLECKNQDLILLLLYIKLNLHLLLYIFTIRFFY